MVTEKLPKLARHTPYQSICSGPAVNSIWTLKNVWMPSH